MTVCHCDKGNEVMMGKLSHGSSREKNEDEQKQRTSTGMRVSQNLMSDCNMHVNADAIVDLDGFLNNGTTRLNKIGR